MTVPDGGAGRWAPLVPELTCADLDASLRFYVDLLGFAVRFARAEDGFAYLDRAGAELMLERRGNGWETGPLDPPLGRGINLQIEVEDARALAARIEAAGLALFDAPAERWYREGDREHGAVEVLVQDPDGYLLRLCQPIGTRARAPD